MTKILDDLDEVLIPLLREMGDHSRGGGNSTEETLKMYVHSDHYNKYTELGEPVNTESRTILGDFNAG